jgi:hypothetical protein
MLVNLDQNIAVIVQTVGALLWLHPPFLVERTPPLQVDFSEFSPLQATSSRLHAE